MAWVNPPAFVTDEVPLTSAKMNLISGDLSYLYTPASCRVYNNAVLAIGTGVWTALTFNSERWDAAGFHSTITNPGRITVQSGYGGEYEIGSSGYFPAAAGGVIRAIRIGVNIGGGGGYIETRYFPNNGAAYPTTPNVTYPWRLSAGDYITVEVLQDSGGALNWTAPEFWARWVSG